MKKIVRNIGLFFTLLALATMVLGGGFEGLTKDNINDFDSVGYTPLMKVIDQYYVDHNDGPEVLQKIETLLKLGADPNIRSKNYRNDSAYTMCNRTPMSAGIMKLLIRYGADVNQYNGRDQSNILRVSEDLSLLKTILEAGLDPDSYLVKGKSTTFLQAFIDDGYFQVVKIMLEHGADPNKSDHEYSKPLIRAFYGNDLKITEVLIKHGAKILENQSISQAIAMENNIELVKLLIKHGADVDEVDAKGNSPLHIAYMWMSKRQRDMKAMIELLIEHGADSTLRNLEGKLPHEV